MSGGGAVGSAPPSWAGQHHAAPRLIALDRSRNCFHRVGLGPRRRHAPWRNRAGVAGMQWGLRGPSLLVLGLMGPLPPLAAHRGCFGIPT